MADRALVQNGQAVLSPSGMAAWLGASLDDVLSLHRYWNDLPPDPHLRDGGRYRYRRHGSHVVTGNTIQDMPHRAHWQPLDYNALHGGIERWFEPLPPTLAAEPAWQRLLQRLARSASALRGEQPWFVESHLFRITTEGGIGRPTPEGAHRDGVDLVAVLLLARQHIKGGETRVFDAQGPAGQRFTLTEPGCLLLLDDARVIHEATPIQPDGNTTGYRDTLVITLRSGAFQDP
ncbi:2OG-Fe dioxygenase family protein [Inhella gelatinilytica]|uniref:2OG-Fe dioxygenase family protein n=1 Tax=Inhella gelatinilytica TaxID=2795030 RepID=A0A931J1S8_9BURK|nr:2OG-Fe dioxygenase family protein [Inhella gelatinilytica]MBH9553786.1 2OG-Fe dioxygenase family protein [Inhella gelatinilytica]